MSGGSDWGLAISRVRLGAHLRLPGSDGGGSDVPASVMAECEQRPDRHYWRSVVVHEAAASPTRGRSAWFVNAYLPLPPYYVPMVATVVIRKLPVASCRGRFSRWWWCGLWRERRPDVSHSRRSGVR